MDMFLTPGVPGRPWSQLGVLTCHWKWTCLSGNHARSHGIEWDGAPLCLYGVAFLLMVSYFVCLLVTPLRPPEPFDFMEIGSLTPAFLSSGDTKDFFKCFHFMCMGILLTWLSVHCVYSAFGGQKKACDPLGLELQMAVSHVTVGN